MSDFRKFNLWKIKNRYRYQAEILLTTTLLTSVVLNTVKNGWLLLTNLSWTKSIASDKIKVWIFMFKKIRAYNLTIKNKMQLLEVHIKLNFASS